MLSFQFGLTCVAAGNNQNTGEFAKNFGYARKQRLTYSTWNDRLKNSGGREFERRKLRYLGS